MDSYRAAQTPAGEVSSGQVAEDGADIFAHGDTARGVQVLRGETRLRCSFEAANHGCDEAPVIQLDFGKQMSAVTFAGETVLITEDREEAWSVALKLYSEQAADGAGFAPLHASSGPPAQARIQRLLLSLIGVND